VLIRGWGEVMSFPFNTIHCFVQLGMQEEFGHFLHGNLSIRAYSDLQGWGSRYVEGTRVCTYIGDRLSLASYVGIRHETTRDGSNF